MCQVPSPCRKLWIFDFDDTLAKTDSRVFLVEPDGTRVVMTPHEYTSRVWNAEEQYNFDYSEFLRLINPRPREEYMERLHLARESCGADRVCVLSARSLPDPIEEFLGMFGAGDVVAHAMGSADPKTKAAWVVQRLATGDVDELEFYDDAVGNVTAIRGLQASHPHVRFVVHHVPR